MEKIPMAKTPVSDLYDSNMRLRTELMSLRHVLRAARERVEAGHNDTCSAALVPETDCSCGHDALTVATFQHDDAYGRDQ